MRMSNLNPNCDGSHCRHGYEEVRQYPLASSTGSSDGALYLCLPCFANENMSRHHRGKNEINSTIVTKERNKMLKRPFILIQEVTKIYNIIVEAENQEEAANVGMNYPIEKWTDNQTGSSALVYVKAEPKGHCTTKYRRQKWVRHRDYWVRRNLRV